MAIVPPGPRWPPPKYNKVYKLPSSAEVLRLCRRSTHTYTHPRARAHAHKIAHTLDSFKGGKQTWTICLLLSFHTSVCCLGNRSQRFQCQAESSWLPSAALHVQAAIVTVATQCGSWVDCSDWPTLSLPKGWEHDVWAGNCLVTGASEQNQETRSKVSCKSVAQISCISRNLLSMTRVTQLLQVSCLSRKSATHESRDTA